MAMSIPEHPIIQNMERTGYPDGREPQYPHCPVCDSECETIYMDRDYEIVGCDVCMRITNAWETEACYPERE